MSSGIVAKHDYVTGLDNLTGEMTLNCQVTWYPNSSDNLTSKYLLCNVSRFDSCDKLLDAMSYCHTIYLLL